VACRDAAVHHTQVPQGLVGGSVLHRSRVVVEEGFRLDAAGWGRRHLYVGLRFVGRRQP
jgi:hypothetical protein